MHAIAGPQTITYMCVEKHNPKAVAQFEKLATVCFELTHIDAADQHPNYTDDQIVLIRMRKKATCKSSALRLCDAT